MKIGITLDASRNSLFTSGINQNGLYLALLFNKGGHDASLLYSKTKSGKSLDEIKDLPIKLTTFQKAVTAKYDIIISLGVVVEEFMAKAFRKQNPNVKFIAYKCGNEFLVDAETYLYDTHEERAKTMSKIKPEVPDAIWSIPQMENTNLQYYSFLLGTDNSTVVPFVWDPLTIETAIEKAPYNLYDGRAIKRYAIMEPNISMMKFCIPPTIIVDRVFKNHKDIEIEKLMLIGASNVKQNKRFINLISKTELAKHKKMSAETRQPTPHILENWAQVVVSWQWENPLNYLYFDVAWMGYPIIHNAHLCKDIGYYYEGFDYEEGERVLADAVRSHPTDKDYLERERAKIRRYTRENPRLVEQYNQLLSDVVNGEFKRQVYDPLTNSVTPK